LEIDEDKLENIRSLFSSTNTLFLMGAGCSLCAGLPLMSDLTESVLSKAQGNTKNILEAIKGEVEGNIEDILSQLINYIAVASKRNTTDTNIQIGNQSDSSQTITKGKLEDALKDTKKLITCNIKSKLQQTRHHRDFVNAVHRTQRPGRTTNASPIHYFILNYDTLIEDALGYEGVSLTDGMEGGSTAYWKPELYKDSRLQAKAFKLHGSLDWYAKANTEIVRRLPEHMRDDEQQLIIAPAESKYAETQAEPYTTLMTQFSNALKPSLKYTTLFIMGYGFGDAHINRHIEQALRFNEKLTVVVLAESVPEGSGLKKWRDNPDINQRLIIVTEDDLWKFENFTKLIGESE
jgi:hypothetical protein